VAGGHLHEGEALGVTATFPAQQGLLNRLAALVSLPLGRAMRRCESLRDLSLCRPTRP